MADLAENTDDWVVGEGLARRESAQRDIAEVEFLLLRNSPEAAQKIARASLETFASSLNWLEDTDHFEEAHRLLDLAGKYVRRTFGCTLHWTGSEYQQTCPVALAHTRIGVSPEIVFDGFDCTICDADAETCPHIAGRVYEGKTCWRRVRGPIQVLAIAWVNRPDQPDARLQSVPVELEKLRKALPPEWRPGMPVSCDRCLLPCEGLKEPDLSSLQDEAA